MLEPQVLQETDAQRYESMNSFFLEASYVLEADYGIIAEAIKTQISSTSNLNFEFNVTMQYQETVYNVDG